MKKLLSSRYSSNDWKLWFPKICSINLWKVLLALHSPNGIQLNSKSPKGVQSRLCFVLLCHRYLIIPTCEVQRWKPLSTCDSIQRLLNSVQGISILLCLGIEQTVVNTHNLISPVFFFFFFFLKLPQLEGSMGYSLDTQHLCPTAPECGFLLVHTVMAEACGRVAALRHHPLKESHAAPV